MNSDDLMLQINEYLKNEVNKCFTHQKEILLQQFSEELESKRSEYVRKICDSICITATHQGQPTPELTFSITIISKR